jgi:hypothetical protein
VAEYNKTENKPLFPYNFIQYIKTKTGVREETAKDYMNTLKNGILIKNKLYKIIVKEGGYICQTN